MICFLGVIGLCEEGYGRKDSRHPFCALDHEVRTTETCAPRRHEHEFHANNRQAIAVMIRTRQGVALCGAFCIFLLVVTSLLINRHYEYLQTPLTAATSGPNASASTNLPQLAAAPPKKPSLEPSGSLQANSRFESYSLPAAECRKEFGDLFKGIERSAAYRRTTGNITSSDLDTDWIDDGSIRAMIYRQKVPTRVLLPHGSLTRP